VACGSQLGSLLNVNALSSNDCSVGNNGAGGVLACGVQGSALANVNLLSSNDCHSG
jgi:hypothetical protein